MKMLIEEILGRVLLHTYIAVQLIVNFILIMLCYSWDYPMICAFPNFERFLHH